MSSNIDVAVLVGSLRKESFTRKLATAMTALAQPGLHLGIVEIGQLPFYNQDQDEGQPPASWTSFRQSVKAVDAVLFVTPEYNRSVPAVLKNAIDVGSRPYGASVWDGKPAAIVSASPGAIGGFGANHHLRQSLVFLNMPTLQQPEAYIGNVAALLDISGAIANEGTRDFLTTFLRTFGKWIDHNSPRGA